MAQLSMPAAQSNQLLTYLAAAVVLTLAALGVVHNTFHLVA